MLMAICLAVNFVVAENNNASKVKEANISIDVLKIGNNSEEKTPYYVIFGKLTDENGRGMPYEHIQICVNVNNEDNWIILSTDGGGNYSYNFVPKKNAKVDVKVTPMVLNGMPIPFGFEGCTNSTSFLVNSSSLPLGEFWIHTYGKGSAVKPAHWTSPNGFEFKDKAWCLAFVAYYQISFFDAKHKEITYVKSQMTSGSKDRLVNIPNNAVRMEIHVSSVVFAKDSCTPVRFNLKASDGAMAFDGTTGSRNFHLKTNDFDSGYIHIPYAICTY